MATLFSVLKKSVALVGLLTTAVLPAHASHPKLTSGLTIAEIVGVSGSYDDNKNDYDILYQAVLAADLVGVLSEGDFTVFAPNDGAFIALANDLGYKGLDEAEAFNAIASALDQVSGGDPIGLLTNVLLYHVSPGGKQLGQIIRRHEVVTAFEGATIQPNGVGLRLADNDPDLRDRGFIRNASNISAANGVIHTIDRVLIPADLPNTQTIADVVAQSLLDNPNNSLFDHNNHDFDMLLQALIAAGLDGAASELEDISVFAPNDLAFILLAQDLGYGGNDEAGSFNFVVGQLTELGAGDPIPLLTDILFYHISQGKKSYDEIRLDRQVVTLLNGGETFDAFGGLYALRLADNDPGLRNPILYRNGDLAAVNGSIQIISRILLPINISGAEPKHLPWWFWFFR